MFRVWVIGFYSYILGKLMNMRLNVKIGFVIGDGCDFFFIFLWCELF